MLTAARHPRLTPARPFLVTHVAARTFGRRAVLGTLVVGGAAVTSGCGLIEVGPAVPAVAADPLEHLITQKQELADQYVATIAAHPDLADRLGPLRNAHRAHRDALIDLLDVRRRAAVARASPPVASPSAGGSADAALGALRGAETRAATSTRAACLQVTDPPAAGDVRGRSARVAVLGSIAAAEASHQVALR